MIKIKSATRNHAILVPSSIKEITPELLKQVTEHVKVPKHYAIVMLCTEVKLVRYIIAVRGKSEVSTEVTSILAKFNDGGVSHLDVKVGDKLVIDRTSIERGHHLTLPIMASGNNFTNYIKSDEKLITAIVQGTPRSQRTKEVVEESPYQDAIDRKENNIVLLAFKIIPINEINAAMDIDSTCVDPFRLKSEEVVN